MDFVTNLANRLGLEPNVLAQMMDETATEAVLHAAQGNPMPDVLTREQLGVVLVALQWNTNKSIRAAARVRNDAAPPPSQTGVKTEPANGVKRRRLKRLV